MNILKLILLDHKKLFVPLGLVILSLKSKNTPLFIILPTFPPFTISLSRLKGTLSLFFLSSEYLPNFIISWCSSISFFGRCILSYSSSSLWSIYCFWPIFALPSARRCSGISSMEILFLFFFTLPVDRLKILLNSSSSLTYSSSSSLIPYFICS